MVHENVGAVEAHAIDEPVLPIRRRRPRPGRDRAAQARAHGGVDRSVRMVVKPTRERQIMPAWSNSTVLHLIDAVAIAIAQGDMLARARLTSHPSPVSMQPARSSFQSFGKLHEPVS